MRFKKSLQTKRSVLVFGAVLAVQPAFLRANSELDVSNGATDLTSGASYVQGTAPTASSDVTFQSGVVYNPTTFTINSNVDFGTLDDLDNSQSLSISNTSGTPDVLTLSGGTNSVAGTNAADLLYVASGGTLNINGGSGMLGLTLAASGNLDIAGSAVISAVITTSNGLTFTGGGTLTLAAANSSTTYKGTTTLSGGTLILGGGANTLPSGNQVDFTANATLDLGGSSQTLELASLAKTTATLTDGTIDLTIGDYGNSGSTFLGTINLTSTATLNTSPTVKLDVRGGPSSSTAYLITAGTVNASGTQNSYYSMLVADGTSSKPQNGSVLETAGTFTVASGVASGAGQFDIGSASTGLVVITGGTFTLASDQVFELGGRTAATSESSAPTSGTAGSGTLTLASTGTFAWTASSTVNSVEMGGGSGSTATINLGDYSTGISFDQASYRLAAGNYGGTLELNRGLILAPSSTAAINFDGGTFLAAGNIPNLIASGITADVRTGGAIIDVNGYSIGIAQALVSDATYTGGGLKLQSTAGGGTLALSGASTYSGPTIINGGTLLANTPAGGSATGSGTVTVNSGGTLAGGSAAVPGYIVSTSGNAVVIQSGATISAGSGASASATTGVLNTSGGDGSSTFGQVWNAGGEYAWKVNPGASTNSTATQVNGVGTTESQAASTPAGTNWDTLVMSSLSIPSTFTINVVPLSSGSAFSAGSSYTWSIADITSGNVNVAGTAYTSSSVASLQAALQAALTLNNTSALSTSGSFSVGAIPDGGGGDDIVIDYSPAPEPTSLALLAMAAIPVVVRRRRANRPTSPSTL